MTCKFCECGSLIIKDKCTNKKCGREFNTIAEEIYTLIDKINNPKDIKFIPLLKQIKYVNPYFLNPIEGEYYNSALMYGDITYKELILKGLGQFVFTYLRKSDDGGCSIEKIRPITPNKNNRGKLNKIMPYMFEHTLLYINQTLTKSSFTNFYFGVTDIDFTMVNPPKLKLLNNFQDSYFPYQDRMLEESANCIALSISNVYTNSQWWKVNVKLEEEYIGITLYSNPTEIKNLFKLRDIPDGEQRRKALRNWVSAHYRNKNNNVSNLEEDKIWVRKHMRGQTNFNWNGLICEIMPSYDDMKELEYLKNW